ncbi:MAG: hypothetical protein Q4F11_00200 [Eubacteriales bacterium]|nr:hypothetical protein [Eubacteriales bacterium]
MKKKRWILPVVGFTALVIVINSLLNYMLVQPGLSRFIFHESEAGDFDCIIVGASHGSYGYSPEAFEDETGMKTMNMCMGGEYYNDAYYVLKYALKYNKPSMVILDVDYQYLVNQHDESILFNYIYNAYPACMEKTGYYFSKMLKEEFRGTFLKWTNYWQCYKTIGQTVKKKQSEEYKNYDSSVVSMNPYDIYKGSGFIYRNSDYKKSDTPCIEWNESKVDSGQLGYIKRIVRLCRSRNIDIVFTSAVQDPEMVGHEKEKFNAADVYIKRLADELGVDYYNFNRLKFSVFARDTGSFYDREGHMYGETAVVFSQVVGELFARRASGKLDLDRYFERTISEAYENIEFTW